ncbi:small integral membrane protein 20 [Pyxicephalus adspersus]|uniref:Small integral membrane protein 20 n=1 Tax=Pyxicephalus adspersus TaxID=30357 RepID=A0AAV3B1X2_PYXAD|nr:TPA: hypothetical protein GDO54_009507 [Pyxicephalus adspersus]
MAGKKGVLIFGGFVVAIAATLYPIIYHPMTHIDEYKKEQEINRAGILQEDVQPPGLKVWTDPFSRK